MFLLLLTVPCPPPLHAAIRVLSRDSSSKSNRFERQPGCGQAVPLQIQSVAQLASLHTYQPTMMFAHVCVG